MDNFTHEIRKVKTGQTGNWCILEKSETAWKAEEISSTLSFAHALPVNLS